MSEIREEDPRDKETVRRVNLAAFSDGSEAAVIATKGKVQISG